MELTLDKRFQKKLAGRIEKYAFQVGILQDSQHKVAKIGERGKGGKDVISRYAGGPIRKKSNKDSGLTVSEVAEENRKRTGVNFWTAPFTSKKSSDIVQFTNTFFRVVTGSSQAKRLTNLLQAIVRNPILRGEYGKESRVTKKIKGFSRPMIDTGQLFKSITAKVIRNV